MAWGVESYCAGQSRREELRAERQIGFNARPVTKRLRHVTGDSPMKLEDKVAIVTGAGRGMGGAIARRFAREGAHVAVAEIDEVSVHETFEAINRRGILVMTDMSSVADINVLVDKTV